MSKRKSSSGKLNLILLIVTLVTSILTGVGMHYTHGIVSFMEKDSRLFMPLYMAALFAVFFFITCLAACVISHMNGTFRADVFSGKNNWGRAFLYMLAGLLITGLLLLGAEFLYESNLQLGSNGTETYIFLIDDSGSMEGNDPDAMRYSVIENTLKGKSPQTRFAVYSFSEKSNLCVPMQTVGEGFPSYPAPDYGLTYMKEGLERVMDDCEQGVWESKDGATLIVITDGFPMDFDNLRDIQPVLDRYVRKGIRIGIVGVIGADNELMNEIATYTGGTFTDIDDAGLMNEAVNLISESAGRTRDLLSARDAVQMDWIYVLIRILTYTLAGALMAAGAALCYGNNTVFSFIIWANIIKSALAGVLMEVAFILPINSAILRLLAWILLGTVIACYGKVDDPDLENRMEIDFFEAPEKERNPFRYD